MDRFGDVGSLDDNVESFLSQDDGDGRDLFGTLKRNTSEHTTDASKGNLIFNTLIVPVYAYHIDLFGILMLLLRIFI